MLVDVMVTWQNIIFIQLGREIAIDEGSQNMLRLGLGQILVALDLTNGNETL